MEGGFQCKPLMRQIDKDGRAGRNGGPAINYIRKEKSGSLAIKADYYKRKRVGGGWGRLNVSEDGCYHRITAQACSQNRCFQEKSVVLCVKELT